MSPEQIQQDLANLAENGELLEKSAQREIWRATVGGQEIHVHFYPSDRAIAGRRIGSGLAGLEFANLQLLQKKKLPAPRVIATLGKFKRGDRVGDANLIRPISTDSDFTDCMWGARESKRPTEPKVIESSISLLERAAEGEVCFAPLTPVPFAISGNDVVIARADDVSNKGLTPLRLIELRISTSRNVTRTTLLRAERRFKPPVPITLDHQTLALAPLLQPELRTVRVRGWQLTFAIRSRLSEVLNDRRIDDPAVNIPRHFELTLNTSNATVLKSDEASRVTKTRWNELAYPHEVVTKEPGFVRTVRGIWRRFRPSRVARTWQRAWELVACGFEIEMPIAMAQKRVLGVLLEQRILFHHVDGEPLDRIDLSPLDFGRQVRLFHRIGRVLARLESVGLVHTDAKSSNWIIQGAPITELSPVMVDLDAIRPGKPGRAHVDRFLRSLRETNRWHADYEAAVWFGYRPREHPMPASLARKPS